MQVSHQNDHVTHAVIGGQKAIEFGISSSAEFFNILSSTLYKDQILAVVREVLCNAWDAHIEAGCTDRPVLITLTEDKFTIQDFGKGIHHDDIGPIYATYGNSTKKNDGNQTGGFGLGCKAPFAYTDHFEVTPCHAGTRTIYAMAKSSAQAMGKPGVTPIASFPTTDSGLTVSIRIKSSDHQRFKQLIHRIARNGDMNMHFNGVQLPTLDFDVSKHNFLLTRDTLLDVQHRVMVRYGNVIYPAEAAGNENAFRAILNHLNLLTGNHHEPFSIVFQAPAHSIAVTPSRESLSMQDHTVNTLRSLFAGFLDSLESGFKDACQKYTKTVTQQAVAEKRVDELLKREESLPRIGQGDVVRTIADFDAMAKTYLQYNYPKGLVYRKADIANRLEAMVQEKLLDRGLVQSFLREMKGVQRECSNRHSWHVVAEKNTWLQRRIIAPLMVSLVNVGLDKNRLFTCGTEDHNYVSNPREGVPPLVPAASCSPHHLLVTLPYLRNIVVLTTRRQDLISRTYAHPVFKAAGQYQGFLVYLVGRKKGDLEAARQFFDQQAVTLVDLTPIEADEVAERPKPTTPRKPAPKGVVKLSGISCGDRMIDTPRMLREDAERTENPEFILQVSLRSGYSHRSFEYWSSTDSDTLVRLFGNKGGITNSTATYNKWREKGAQEFEKYIVQKISSYILNNTRIETYLANQARDELRNMGQYPTMVRLIQSHELFSKEFGFTNPLTEEDRTYLGLWDNLKSQYRYHNSDDVIQTKKWISGIAASPQAVALNKLLGSPMLRLLDTSEFRDVVTNGSTQEVEQAMKILKTLLNP